MSQERDTGRRVVFLDNIRWLMVVLVVMLHTGVAYSRTVPWWHVLDAQRSQFFDILNFMLDVVLMPVLFFIAGYFTIPSFRRRRAGGFIMAKLRRLGVPLVLLTIFCTPIMPYIRYYRSMPDPSGFFPYWKAQIATALDMGFIHAQDTATILLHGDEFAQHHLWFLSLLLFFFLCFAAAAVVVTALKKRDGSESGYRKESNTRSMFVALLIAGMVISTGFAIINLLSRDGAWVKLGNLLLFQPTRVPLYAGLFLLGIYAHSRNWFTQHPIPGTIRAWAVACLVMTFLLLALGESFYAHDPAPFGVAIAHGLVRTFFCLASIGLLTAIGFRYWNRPTKLNRSLAASSYDIYLLHLPLVVVFQFAFLMLSVPIFIKFAVIFMMSFITSWGMSAYLVRPHPKLSIAALLGAFALTALFVVS